MTNTNDKKIYKYAYNYTIDLTAPKKDNIIESELQALTFEQYHNATSDETLRFFKAFGKTTFKYIGGYCYEWRSTSPDKTQQAITRYYDSIDALIKREGFTLEELTPNQDESAKSFYKKAYIIRDKKENEKGLKSYNELVAIFNSGHGIYITGYYSQTTCRHLNSYLMRPHFKYTNLNHRLSKKDISKNKYYYFAKV